MKNKTITVDLESWTPSVLNNWYDKMLTSNTDWGSFIREYSLQWLPDDKPEPKSPYKFSRAKWWEAEFSETDYLEVRKWCMEQFGPEPWPQDAWSRWYHKYYNRIFFRDHQDYVLFLLRWS